ncbi:MAG: DUF2114 family protein, partial [Candidatus Thorarchaeota archaeon]
VRGSGLVDPILGSVLDISRLKKTSVEIDSELVTRVHNTIQATLVPKGTKRFGTVPVNTDAAEEANVRILGVDVGNNGSGLQALERIGAEITENHNVEGLLVLIDQVMAHLVQRLISIAESEDLVLVETSLGLTGRAITSGNKPLLITNTLLKKNNKLWSDSHQLVFVEDGLAMGAAVAARCMNSLGTIHNPMGGRKGDGCIMGARMKQQKKHDR